VNQDWFEAFIMSNILLIGIATGIDLENRCALCWFLFFVAFSLNWRARVVFRSFYLF
jgi:hypothetical protein